MTTKQIVDYGVTDTSLEELDRKYKGFVFDASTSDGYEHCKAAISELRPLRTGIERKRVELKADALAYGRKVDSEAKRITQRITSLEDPAKEAKLIQDNVEKEKKAKIEREQNQLIDHIKEYPSEAIGKTPDEISSMMESLDNLDLSVFTTLEGMRTVSGTKESSMVHLANHLDAAIEKKANDDELARLKEVERLRMIDQLESDHEYGLVLNEKFNRDLADKIEAERVAEENRQNAIKEEARIKAEAEAKDKIEQANRERDEAVKRQEQEAIQARLDSDTAAKEATANEAKRQADERARLAAEEKARASDKKHKATINNQMLDAFVSGGLSAENAKTAVKLLASGRIPNIKVNY